MGDDKKPDTDGCLVAVIGLAALIIGMFLGGAMMKYKIIRSAQGQGILNPEYENWRLPWDSPTS